MFDDGAALVALEVERRTMATLLGEGRTT